MTRDELIEAVAHAIDPRPWTFSSGDDVKRYGEKHDLARRAKSLKTAARVLDALDALNMKPERVAELERALQSAAPPINVITIGEEGGGHDIVVEGWRFPPQGLRLTDQRDFDCARELARENARLRAAMEWRPIESAPRDGTEFQAWIDDKFGWWEPRCRYDDGGNFQIWTRIDYDIEGWEWVPHLSPTHWTPVPTAPEGE